MKEIIGKAVVGMIPGAIASMIAIVVTWNYMDDHQNVQDASVADLSARLSIIEATIPIATDKRYRSTDAERDQRLMMVYVDKGDRAIRDELAKLRIELNKRIDTMHTEGR